MTSKEKLKHVKLKKQNETEETTLDIHNEQVFTKS